LEGKKKKEKKKPYRIIKTGNSFPLQQKGKEADSLFCK